MTQHLINLTLEYTHVRLIRWGHWCNRILESSRAYPSMTTEAKLMMAGIISKNTNIHATPQNPSCEEIDKLITQLGNNQPKLARMLWIHYVSQIPIKEKIERSKLPRSTYFHQLKKAKQYISKRLK